MSLRPVAAPYVPSSSAMRSYAYAQVVALPAPAGKLPVSPGSSLPSSPTLSPMTAALYQKQEPLFTKNVFLDGAPIFAVPLF